MNHVAEYHGTDGSILPYGIGPTREDAIAAAVKQFAGADFRMRAYMRSRIVVRTVCADEASEIIEYFETVW